MKQSKNKLKVKPIIILIIFALLLFFIMTYILRSHAENEQFLLLETRIESLTTYIENEVNPTRNEIIHSLNDSSQLTEDRLTFMTTEGEILFDSIEADTSQLENPFNHSTIQNIVDGEIIHSKQSIVENTEQANQFSVASVIRDENANPLGIVLLSDQEGSINEVSRFSMTLQLVTILLLFSLVVFLFYWERKQVRLGINRLKNSVTGLQVADYNIPYTGSSTAEIDELGTSVNQLTETLKVQHLETKANEERMSSLVNHLVIGVMLLDNNRRLQLVNPTMNEMLGSDLYGRISYLYTDCIKSAELIELIEESYKNREAVNSEITTYYPEEKILDVNVIPIPGMNQDEQNYIVLLYDITEIRQLENVRTDFVTNVSHELRTPITALKGFSETLLDGAMNDKEVLVDFLEIMSKEATRLDSMIQDILQLSSLEQKQVPTTKENLNIREVVDEVLQILHQKIELKSMNCTVEEVAENLTIFANRDQLKQVLMNLIANAVAYTPEAGTVTIKIESEDQEAKIQVIDNGIGIPATEQSRIFERFYRVDKARSRNSGGTGLGLAIVKWVLDNMNGRIELYSQPGLGTTFIVWLPK